jgi:SsrA-binding protein
MGNILITNRKATFEFEILEELVAGVVLMGTEVKSLKNGKASLSEAYCHIINDEIFIKEMHISEYKLIKHTNHEPLRERKLLLKKGEILKLHKKIKERGLTIIPLNVHLTDTGYIKIKIALAKGKKVYNKKETIRLRDLDRDLKRNT